MSFLAAILMTVATLLAIGCVLAGFTLAALVRHLRGHGKRSHLVRP